MLIKKFLHSCLLVEEGGQKLLIDPGTFAGIGQQLEAATFGPVDIILLTHKHPDHFDPVLVRALAELGPTVIITHDSLGKEVEAEGMEYEPIQAGETIEYGPFSLKGLPAPHGPIPTEVPPNLAYLINDKLMHTGDSLDVEVPAGLPVLALPIAAPWLRLVDALDLAKKAKPKHVIPIHDAFIKDYMLDRMYKNMCAPMLTNSAIAFHPLGFGESLDLP